MREKSFVQVLLENILENRIKCTVQQYYHVYFHNISIDPTCNMSSGLKVVSHYWCLLSSFNHLKNMSLRYYSSKAGQIDSLQKWNNRLTLHQTQSVAHYDSYLKWTSFQSQVLLLKSFSHGWKFQLMYLRCKIWFQYATNL